MQALSRLIVKHESEWANSEKWKQLIDELEKQTGPKAQHAEELKRIDKLTWWDEVRAGVPGFPGPEVFHIHPIGLVGNFHQELQLITLEMLLAVDSSNSRQYYDSILAYLNAYAKVYEVGSPKRIAHFLSQAAHESHFRASEEDLTYGPKNMRKTFGCKGGKKNYNVACDDCTHGRLRDKLWSLESHYSNNPEHLANYVYADRLDNGDESSGDGFKYRGRGIIQVTGKTGYQSFQDEHNRRSPHDQRNFVENPELVSSNLEYGVESAFVFWSNKRLNSVSDTGTVEDVTRIVNGGQNGYDDRLHRFNSVATILGISKE
jgi:predicted chitinase